MHTATTYASSTFLRLLCHRSSHQNFQRLYRLSLCLSPGILIKTTIEAGYTDDDTITLRQHPELVYKLHHKVNGLPYVTLVDDNTVRQRGLRMGSPFDLLQYTDHKAMEMLPAQWEHHDPGNTRWTAGEE